MSRCRHATRAHASADAATPEPARLQRRALLAASLGGLFAPRALASGSPYDDVLPPIGVLNGCVPHAPCKRASGLTSSACSRLQACPSTFNCVSTSSRSSDQYTAPWVAAPELKSAKQAADEVVEAVRVLFPQAELVTSEALPTGHYVRFRIPGRFSLPDEIEFLVRNEGVGDRNFSGDDAGGLLVTLRSVAGTVQCALLLGWLAFAFS